MENEPESPAKNERMYSEIRFQRNLCQSLKKEAAVFRLKRNGKNLETSEYASNLCQYLDQSRSVTNLTMSDLRNVLIGLSHTEDMTSMPNETNVQTSSLNSYSKPNNEFQCGEH